MRDALTSLRRTQPPASVVALSLALLSFVILSATSQPPVPSAGKSQRSQPQPTAQGAQQQTATDPRGTDNTPIVVKVQPSAKTDEETANEQRQEQREASAQRWTVGSVIGTVIIGLLQVGAIGFQVYIAKKQNTIIETQTSIMQLQERAASSSAIAAKAQTEHMLAGLAETRKATEALKTINRQWVKVERWMFNAWNVPKVGLHAEVIVEISNKTPLPLTIFAVRCYINDRKGSYGVADEYLVPDATTQQAVKIVMNERELAEYNARRLRLVITGWVHYWDAFGDLHSEIIAACLEHIGPGVAKPSVRGVAGVMRKMPRMEKEWPVQEMLDWMDQRDREKDDGEHVS
jgi:hypothetical protein